MGNISGTEMTGHSLKPQQADPVLAGTIVLTDQLDQYAAENLRALALGTLSGGRDVIFDLTGLDRIHTACLQVFIALQHEITPQGRRVILRSAHPSLRRVFSVAGVEDSFTFLDRSL